MSIETLREKLEAEVLSNGTEMDGEARLSIDDARAILAHLQPSPEEPEKPANKYPKTLADTPEAREFWDSVKRDADMVKSHALCFATHCVVNAGGPCSSPDAGWARRGSRSPSPDLRGLVEQWRQRSANESWLHTEGRAASFAFDQCADDLEAALATTPEPTSMEKIQSVIESLKNEAESLRYDVGEKARVSALRHAASRLERAFGL